MTPETLERREVLSTVFGSSVMSQTFPDLTVVNARASFEPRNVVDPSPEIRIAAEVYNRSSAFIREPLNIAPFAVGSADAAMPTNLGVFAGSPNNELTRLGTIPVLPVDQNDFQYVDAVIEVTPGLLDFLLESNRRLTLVADVDNTLPELNEANNHAIAQVTGDPNPVVEEAVAPPARPHHRPLPVHAHLHRPLALRHARRIDPAPTVFGPLPDPAALESFTLFPGAQRFRANQDSVVGLPPNLNMNFIPPITLA